MITQKDFGSSFQTRWFEKVFQFSVDGDDFFSGAADAVGTPINLFRETTGHE
jgi:hypothetical protein